MTAPTAFLHSLRTSSADLVQSLTAEHWSDADVGAASLCAGWTRGHVLTHIARNADGIADTLAGALRGEIVARYPGGTSARNAAIDEGAHRPVAALVADVRDSTDRLDRVLGAVGDADAWRRPTEHGDPAHEWVLRRWREVEVHRVDLSAGYTPDRWPPLLVTTLLPREAESLGNRADHALRVEVLADGSLAPDLIGRVWRVGGGDPLDVRGPDWALLAWLAGRPSVAAGALNATPSLTDWR